MNRYWLIWFWFTMALAGVSGFAASRGIGPWYCAIFTIIGQFLFHAKCWNRRV